MKTRSESKLATFTTLALLALNLIAFNVLLSKWSGARLDLTGDRRYSISETTRKTLRSLDEPVTVTGYFSARTHPKLAPLVPQIRDLLDEYAAVSGGRLEYRMVDPGESVDAEREATQRYGIRPTPFQLQSKYEAGIVNAYFGLVVKYGDQYKRYGFEDLIDVSSAPDGDVDVRLRNLEYDLTRGIRKVVSDFRKSSGLFASVSAPVRFTAIITPSSLPEVFKDVPATLQSAVDELKKKAGDKLTYEVIDPTSNPALAAQVDKKYGARPLQLGLLDTGAPFYLYGIVELENRTLQLDLTRANLTAADVREGIEQALQSAVPGFVRTIGIVSPDPSLPPEVLRQLQMQGQMPQMPPPRFEALRESLGQSYRVEGIELGGTSGVPGGVDVLVVIQPSQLDENALYNLDQFLMRGGRVIVCAGNYESSFTQMGLSVVPATTGLDDWLAHHGVSIDKTLVLDDRNHPLPVPEIQQTPFGQIQTWRMAPYPYLLRVEQDGLADRNVTGALQAVGLYWASPVKVVKEKLGTRKAVTILRSSETAWTDSDVSRTQMLEYSVPPDAHKLDLAVALSGRFTSYFKGKPAPAPKNAEGAPPPPPRVIVEESPDTRLVVVGNSEFLSDFVARALGSADSGFFAENLRFIENLADWTTQDSDMMAIRARGVTSHRLHKTARETEVLVETANYMIPLILVTALGFWRVTSRRKTRPLFASASTAKGVSR